MEGAGEAPAGGADVRALWSVEVAQVLDADYGFHVEGAGSTADGSQLFAVYRQEA